MAKWLDVLITGLMSSLAYLGVRDLAERWSIGSWTQIGIALGLTALIIVAHVHYREPRSGGTSLDLR